ncbi:acyltransferase family protein [Maribacter sp. Hel_I_7]|uniref:acyltransferase family protein n=1 Tax=Maribacter sp. Hel_I_7 TaxID=1249997 RepID=UPI00047CF91D|nr:acyltransferase [Maribacter sp. Hel_I_7]
MSQIFKYNPSLDGLRGIAVICVLLVHASYGKISGGFLGVDLFFVLSGYLITAILLKEFTLYGNISYFNFYIKRFLRLLPPLAVCIILYLIYQSYISPTGNESPLLIVFSSLFYFVNFVHESYLGPLVHLWSLSVEEHFYLFWPILMAGLIFKLPKRKQMIFIFFFIAIITVFRIWVYYTNSIEPMHFGIFSIDSYRFTFCRIDAIMLGGLAAIGLSEDPNSFNLKIQPNLGLILLLAPLGFLVLFLDVDNLVWRYGGFIGTNLLALAIILFAVKNPKNRILGNSILLWFGQRSYGIYVYHYLIFLAMEPLRVSGSVSNLIIVTTLRVVASLLFAEISYRIIEKPILKLKSKFQNKGIRKTAQL